MAAIKKQASGWEDTKPPAPGAIKPAPRAIVEQSTTNTANTANAEPPKLDENQMVIVDVVIIRTEENITTAKGVNLL